MKTCTPHTTGSVDRWARFLGGMLTLALMVPAAAFSQGTAPPMGTAANFGVLAQAAISGSATITGDVGTLSGAISGTITAPGYTVYPINDAVVQTANADLLIAYNDAAGQIGGTTLPDGILTGTLTAGVYVLSAAASNLLTTVTLDGGGVFIFQASSTLITSNSSSVLLTNGTVWSDVYWQVGSSATLGPNSTFEGTILANTTITVGTGATLTGRLLAGAVTATGAVTVNSDVLPVELVAFTATANRLNADLHWSTATEVNNYGFEIERRQTANWEKVGFVRGAGTSSSPRYYSFTDVKLTPARYAYRIKQIDTDGSFKYYTPTEVEVGLAAKKLVLEQNYPNPFNPNTEIEFTVPERGFVSLKVYTMLGQEVATLFSGFADAGRIQQVTFDASWLPSGLYFSRLDYAGQHIVRKMTLMK